LQQGRKQERAKHALKKKGKNKEEKRARAKCRLTKGHETHGSGCFSKESRHMRTVTKK